MKNYLFVSFVIVSLLCSCGGKEAIPSLPTYTITKVSGDDQSGYTSTALAQPVIVRLSDEQGQPVKGVAMVCTVISGGGSVLNASLVTDNTGKVSFTWTIGGSAGPQKISINAYQDAGSPYSCQAIECSASAAVPEVVTLAKVSGDQQECFPGGQLFSPILVKIADKQGVALPNANVICRVTEGDGKFAASDSVSSVLNTHTDASGQLSIVWNMGKTAGLQKMTVTPKSYSGKVIAGTPLEFTANSNLAFLAGKWYFQSFYSIVDIYLDTNPAVIVNQTDFGGGYLDLVENGKGTSLNKGTSSTLTYTLSNNGAPVGFNKYGNNVASLKLDDSSNPGNPNIFLQRSWIISSYTGTTMTLTQDLGGTNSISKYEIKLAK